MLSSMQMQKGGAKVLYVDATNNPGFSGGPLFFTLFQNSRHTVHVAGIVPRFRVEQAPVIDVNGNKPGMTVDDNTGIMLSYDFEHARDLVTAHRAKQV